MQPTYEQRIRIKFSKVGPTRFIGHLDVARTWERALNRARIPIDYTHGFNRRPKMQFATATPLGTTSDCELLDIWLRKTMEPDQAREQLMSRMAPGIEIVDIEDVALSEPALQTMTRSTTMTATLIEPEVDHATLQSRIDALLSAESIMRERTVKKKRRVYDLRPLILSLKLAEPDPDSNIISLTVELVLEPSRTGRVDEVLRQLELDPLSFRVHRTEMVIEKPA